MIITKCAACAAQLAHDAPRCVGCQTRYCSDRCQRYDRRRGGHGKMCGAIASGGGAERYHAEKKYKEAVAVAVEQCAEDTEGQTCYICLEAVHPHTGEGLVRGCACRGTAGFAHVSCLAEQTKILYEEAMENNLDDEVLTQRWNRWHECRLCEQRYHGVVSCALGWACWKTYVGRPDGDRDRIDAMTELGNGLYDASHHEDALTVQEAELSVHQRLGGSEADILVVQNNLANAYEMLGRVEQALCMRRDVYSGRLKLNGEENEKTLRAANNLAVSLKDTSRFDEAKSLLRKTIPVAQRILGESDQTTHTMRKIYADALYKDDDATLDDVREAVATLADLERTSRRVLGGAHPFTEGVVWSLRDARAALRARETPPSPPPAGSV